MPAVLLFLRTQLRVLDIPGKLGILSLDTLVVAPLFGRDPLVQGRCSFVEGRSKSSIAYFENDLALFGRHTVCSRSRMGGLADYLEMGFGERGPSI